VVEVVGVLVTAGDGEDARPQDVSERVYHARRLARVRDQRRQPTSEVNRPPSKAAVSFLRPTARSPSR
jgi:hypothetical protein